MKVLLRRYKDDYYVWKEAKYDGNRYIVDGESFSPVKILAVKDHDCGNSVICNYCHEVIKNDPKSIEAHYAEHEAKANCLACKYMRPSRPINVDRQYEKNANGTYKVMETYDANLYCQYMYHNVKIGTDVAKEICECRRHRREGVRPYGDALIQFPDLFEKQITVDLLNKKEFQFKEYRYGFFEYDLKCRNTLFACVNENGIVDHFKLYHKYECFSIYYSATHNKLFFEQRGQYDEEQPYRVSDSKYNTIKKKIESLYKEV